MQMPDIQAAGTTGLEDAVRVRGNREDHAKPLGGLKGAETARNGSSFLAMIEKMIAGSMEGMSDVNATPGMNKAGRGAGGAEAPGDANTLIKPGSGGKRLSVSKDKGPIQSGSEAGAAKAFPSDARGGRIRNDPGLRGSADHTGPGGKPQGLGTGADGSDALSRAALTAAQGPESGEVEAAQATVGKRVGGKRAGDAVCDNLTLLAGYAPSAPDSQGAGAQSLKASRMEAGDGEGHGDSRTVKSARSDRRDKKATFSVHDERTLSMEERIASGKTFEKTVRDSGDGTADMTIDFRADSARGSGSQDGRASLMARDGQAEGQTFGAMLSQELRENAADFVKTGHIVLKDNNAGLIRLTLHPESLGNVRINLELSSDRKITGRIVVSSREAYEAFNESLQGLSDAFVEGGFESAGFDLSWSGSEAQAGWQEADGSRSSPFYASSIPDVMSGPKTADIVEVGYRGSGLSVIDVLA